MYHLFSKAEWLKMWLQFLSFQIFLQHLEVEQHVHSHSTELKNRILVPIPELKLIEKLCGDDNFVIILGGLHTEMAERKVIGDWLKDSGWVEALVHAKVASKVACIP